MKVKILGCGGGRAPSSNLTSFLVDGTLLLDAGGAAGSMTIKQQAKIDHMVISHAHLDHVKDIPMVADNIIGMRTSPIEVIATKPVIDTIRKHLLNNAIWPDFTMIPTKDDPIVAYKVVRKKKDFQVGKYTFKLIAVNHPVPTVAMFITGPKGTLLYTGDTGYTDEIWKIAHKQKDLLGVIVETSFTNDMKWLSELSGHLSPCMLAEELQKLDRPEVPIYVTHIKPSVAAAVKRELRALKRKNLTILKDGDELKF